MSESKKIIKRMYGYLEERYYPIAPNNYIYTWESDIIAVNKLTGYVTEYEVKISRGDYKADFKKEKKHEAFSNAFLLSCNLDFIPNYFYYVTTPGLIDKKELPPYAGLIEVGIYTPRIVQRAPLLHKNKKDLELQLLKKIYFKFWGKFND